ncbi:MAG TPA: cobyrinate a,c-diamide synthase [Bacillota bacterium]|nr:cobyrinate a,c-diamide synthase [Bacillota bacterium]
MQIPRIVIAGTHSGCGKTTVTTGILAAFAQRGLQVQPFKVGPDYLDPMFHTYVTRNPSRNLDSWLLDDATLVYLFQRAAADKELAVIEGVMGLFDGLSGDSQRASTAHVAEIINAPVVLVVNGEGMALSIAALIRGFRDFNPTLKLKGVILNNINSESYFQYLKEIIETHTGLQALGYLPELPETVFPQRHLGLIPTGEIRGFSEKIKKLAVQVSQTVDLNLLLTIAREAEPMTTKKTACEIRPEYKNLRLAIARDAAFNFYYHDNLDLLQRLGAELIYFSPIQDARLPEGINGLYMGGGFPEVWAEALRDNAAMRQSVKQMVEKGLPTYAECGGLLYLTNQLINETGKEYRMVGVLDGQSVMTQSLQHFGYVDIEFSANNLLGRAGDRVRGHEFHFSETQIDPSIRPTYRISKSLNNKLITWEGGYQVSNLLAAYPHLHFWSNPVLAKQFLGTCNSFPPL